MAEQAKILWEEAEENNLDWKVKIERWGRWYKCSLCEQKYHGVVAGALGWACWKTYVSRPEGDWVRISAMRQIGNGLSATEKYEDAFSVKEAELAMLRRFGYSEENQLAVQGNLAMTYQRLGRYEQAMHMLRDVYSGRLKLHGEEHDVTLIAANNYAHCLLDLRRFDEAKALFRNTMPVARRVLGDSKKPRSR